MSDPDHDLARRRSLLTAALGAGFSRVSRSAKPPEVQTVRRWLDSWTGVGHAVTGMQRQDYRLHLTDVDSVWRRMLSGERGAIPEDRDSGGLGQIDG